MEPKTKLQVEVWGLHLQLDSVVDKQPFMISKHGFFYATHYKNIICLECNHAWKPEVQVKDSSSLVKCPSCRNKLQKINFQNGSASRFLTFSVVQTVGRFQVFRYFSCWKHMYKNKKPKYFFSSLFEEWKDYDKNKSVIVGRIPSWTGDGFSSSGYEVRYINASSWKGSEYHRYASDLNCPGAEFLPRFEKYGLKKDFHNCDYRYLLKKLEANSEIETLLKAKQKDLLFYAVHKDERFRSFWPQIKLVIRHKYKIADAGIWYDYLDLLRYFGKDLNSPKYLFPKNLTKEHDRLVAKKREFQQRQEIQKKRQRIENAQAEYEKQKKLFFGLQFQADGIVVRVLETVQEFMEEGDLLKHCVFTNDYYNKKDSLVMSARIGDKPLETVEISLSKLKILQARGMQNKATDYHDTIVELVNSNLHKIKAIVKKQKKAA